MLPITTFRREYGDVLALLTAITLATTVGLVAFGKIDAAVMAVIAFLWAGGGYLVNRYGGKIQLADHGWAGTRLGELRIRKIRSWWGIPTANIGYLDFDCVGETRAGEPRWRLVVVTTGGAAYPTPTTVVGPTGEQALASEFGPDILEALAHLLPVDPHGEDRTGFGFALDA